MSQSRKPHIQVIGSLNIDLVTTTPRLPAGGETLTASTFATHPGGKGANQAVACARASRHREQIGDPDQVNESDKVKVSMLGAIGDDAYGKLLVETLNADGINCDNVKKTDTTTGVAVIIVENSSGENRILLTPGANASMQKGTVNPFAEQKPDLVVMQLEIPCDTVLDIIAQARERGVDVLLNPAPAVPLPESSLDGLAHLVLNETEASILCGIETPSSSDNAEMESFLSKAFLHLAKTGVRNIVITLGGNGVAYCTPKDSEKPEWQKVDACSVEKVVDTTAAGDTFVGYYAVGLAEAKTEGSSGVFLEPIVTQANRAAALTVTRQGAMGSIPYSDEVA